jgi:hypothetical protein
MAAGIRPFKKDDVLVVTALLRAHMAGWNLDERAVVGLMLDHPWADEELPSLVAEVDGEVVGFFGVQARRVRFDGRTIRATCTTHAVVDPAHRAGAAGAFLIARSLRGSQELTWSDSATDAVLRVWRISGGEVDYARACDWLLVLRSARWLGGIASGALRRRPVAHRTLVPVGALPAQALGSRLLRRAFPPLSADVEGADASASEIAEHVSELNEQRRLWIDHDAEHLEHLFRLVETFRGPLVRRVVRRGGRVIGWYAYLLRPGEVSRVLHLAARDADADDVLGELLRDAHARGSAAATGRAEPHLRDALERRFAVLGYARRPVWRTKNAELASALATSSSLLTRLDGEVFAT